MAASQEDFHLLKAQVDEQDKAIKRLNDFLTYQEGAGHETLEARLASAMKEITIRSQESEERFQKEINKNKVVMENIKGNLEHLIDVQRVNINELKLKDVKELKAKVDEIEMQVITEGTQAANVGQAPGLGGAQEPSSAGHGAGEPQTSQAGPLQDLRELIGDVQQNMEELKNQYGGQIVDLQNKLAEKEKEIQNVEDRIMMEISNVKFPDERDKRGRKREQAVEPKGDHGGEALRKRKSG